MTLQHLVDYSGDSIIKDYTYTKGILILNIEVTELEKNVRIIIKTNTLSVNNYFEKGVDEIYRTCRIEILDLTSLLSAENNIYIPPKGFVNLMNEFRSNYNLAYGERQSDIKYLFSLVGYGRLASCLVSDLSMITIEEI